MKRTTKKLSGIGLELFLRRFYANYRAIDATLAEQLAKDSARTFSSVRVRRVAWCTWRRKQAVNPAPDAANPAPGADRGVAEQAAQPSSAVKAPVAAAAPAPPTADSAPLDPYAIGLLPTYQREGPDGLLAKLNGITSADHLRKMARAQQIALPTELRSLDAAIDDIRSAIVAAVGKRIANRRAAAG